MCGDKATKDSVTFPSFHCWISCGRTLNMLEVVFPVSVQYGSRWTISTISHPVQWWRLVGRMWIVAWRIKPMWLQRSRGNLSWKWNLNLDIDRDHLNVGTNYVMVCHKYSVKFFLETWLFRGTHIKSFLCSLKIHYCYFKWQRCRYILHEAGTSLLCVFNVPDSSLISTHKLKGKLNWGISSKIL